MKKAEVHVGRRYVAKISGQLTKVRLTSESRFGGWDGINEATGRSVRIKSAAKLRRPVSELSPEAAARADRCDHNEAEDPLYDDSDIAAFNGGGPILTADEVA